jgi:hypothetical protein
VGPKNQNNLLPCDVARGGTYSLAVERTQNNQQYSMRLYYTNGVNVNLAEGVPSPGQIGDVNDEIYFKYTVPANILSGGQSATQQQQIYFILDSVVGGVVQIQPLFNQAPGTQCAGGNTCASIEGYAPPLLSFFVLLNCLFVVITSFFDFL